MAADVLQHPAEPASTENRLSYVMEHCQRGKLGLLLGDYSSNELTQCVTVDDVLWARLGQGVQTLCLSLIMACTVCVPD